MSDLMVDYVDLLSRFMQYKTVSADPSCKEEMVDCAVELAKLFTQRGFTHSEVVNGFGNPIVFAHYDAGSKKTALIYGHYDVQPADISEGWKSDPFTAQYREGTFYGRGTNDMKGLLLVQMVAAFDLIKNGNLAYNLTFVIEGNEESAGGNMRGFVEKYSDRLNCDVILTSDGQGMVIDTSYRGTFNAGVRALSKHGDQHSGMHGGQFPSPGWGIVELANRAQNLLSDNRDDWCNPLTAGLNDSDFNKSFEFRPYIEVTGLQGGYTGESYRNSIMGEATAKFNIRLGPLQNANDCATKFKEWLEKQCQDIAPDLEWVVEVTNGEQGAQLWTDADIQRNIRKKAEKVIGREIPLRACGGTIPVFPIFQEILCKPIVSLSIGSDDSNIHGVDENITFESIERGLKIYKAIFSI